MSSRTHKVVAIVLALSAWVAGTLSGSLGGAPSAQAHPTFVIGKTHADFLPVTDPERPIFLLLIGSDARPGTPIEKGIADSLHILGINVAENRATLYGIPRDSYVPLASGGTGKINSSMPAGGPQATVQTVENLTGITIDYYVLTGFVEFIHFVDGIDGAQIDNPFGFVGHSHTYPKGEQTLTGAAALGFARERHALPRGDFHRSWNQGVLLEGLLQQFRGEFGHDQASMYTWLGEGLREVQTELPINEVIDLAFAVSRLRTTRLTNLVALGSTGSAGGSSVVMLSAPNDALWADMGQDGFILQKDVPPDAQPGL